MSKTESTAVNDLISQVHQGRPSGHSSDLGDELQFDRKPPSATPMPRPRAAGTQVHSVGGRPGSLHRERATLPPPIPGKATLFGAAVTRNSTKRMDPPIVAPAVAAVAKDEHQIADVDVTMDFVPEAFPELEEPKDVAQGPRWSEPAKAVERGPHVVSEEFEREAATVLRRPDDDSPARRSAPLTLDGTPLENQFAINQAAPGTVLYEDSAVMSSAPKAGANAARLGPTWSEPANAGKLGPTWSEPANAGKLGPTWSEPANAGKRGRSLAKSVVVVAAEPAAEVRGGFDEDRWHEFTGSNHLQDESQRFTMASAKKWIAPVAGVSLVAAFAIGYFYFNSARGQAAIPAAPVATAAPTVVAPEPAPVVNPASIAPSMPAIAPVSVASVAQPIVPPPLAAPEPAVVAPVVVEDAPASVKLVNVRFESKPDGATVTIMDGGRATLLGSTPITAAVDSRQTYDAVFAIEGRVTQLKHFSAKRSRTVKADLRRARRSSSRADSRSSFVESPKETAIAQAPAAPTAAASASGRSGTLMISTKPPCDIMIDGKPTGLMTPQRNLVLKPGTHKITLSNASNGIKKQIAVTVVAGKSTKLVQDYSSLIRR